METDPINIKTLYLKRELLYIAGSMKKWGGVLEDLTLCEDDYDEKEIIQVCRIQKWNASNYIKRFDELKTLKAQEES